LKNFNIHARFLKNPSVPYEVPDEWVDQTINFGFGGHFFLKEAYHVLKSLEGRKIEKLKILDLGCGDAVVDCLLALMGAEVVAVDYDDNFLASAKRYAGLYNVNDKIKFIKGDIRKLPLKTKQFDVVWNGGVIEHFRNPDEVLKDMAGLTKSRGMVIVNVPNYWTLHTFFYRPIMRLLKRFPFDCWGREKSFRKVELKDMMSQAGLKDIGLMTFDLQPAFLMDIIFIPILSCRVIRKIAPHIINLFDYLEEKSSVLTKVSLFLGAKGTVE